MPAQKSPKTKRQVTNQRGSSRQQHSSTNQLRIIGGQWRSRKLSFPDVEGLRPTSDRIRETVFNWLAPYISSAHCLDLFAGSGAMGLEALSRGAISCQFNELDTQAAQALKHNISLLEAQNAKVNQTNTLDWLSQNQDQNYSQDKTYNLVFLDPPFAGDLLADCFSKLATSRLLAPDALIYWEADKHQTTPALPEGWISLKHKQTGQVQFGLIQAQC